MKICQVCRITYQDEMQFCLNDGSVLVNLEDELSEATLNLPQDKLPFTNQNEVITAVQPKFTNPANYPYPNKKTSNSLVLGLIIGVILLLSVVGISFRFIYQAIKNQPPIVINTPNKISPTPITNVTPIPKAQLKVEIQDKVKGSFGRVFLRCLVTNISEGVVTNPKISLMLSKNDVKVGTVFGDSKLEFLKPNQTIPIWVDISNKEFTKAEFENAPFARLSDKDEKSLYPTLSYTDTKMTSQTLTSSYNFRNYPEVFYKVKGIVENADYEKISPQIYVFFYDENKQIVGIDSTNPPSLKKGEKAEFEVQVGETEIFGKPKDFEIFATAK